MRELEVNQVYCMDALELLRLLPDNSVDLAIFDWPYNGVKDDEWDNQWATDGDYLDWMKTHLRELRRVLKPNGNYYGFASPRTAARVEVLTGEFFNVLNHIVWNKPYSRHNQTDLYSLRGYFPQTERIVFADQVNSDHFASGESGFIDAETQLKKQIFGDPIRIAMNDTQTSAHELTEAIGAFGAVNHGGAVSNWINGFNIPTKDYYYAMRDYLNNKGGDYLRREYEDLRRPFNMSEFRPYTDVWTFPTVAAYPGKHPCEKPAALLEHIILSSSKPDAIVLDAFCGSGSTLTAAKRLQRRYIGNDRDPHWSHISTERLKTEFASRKQKPGESLDDLPLFRAAGEGE